MHQTKRLLKISLVSLLFIFIAPLTAVHATGFSMTVGCDDGTSKITQSSDKKKFTTTIACKSGGKLLSNPADAQATNQVIVNCKGQESVGDSLPNGKITFYCEFIGTAGGDPTTPVRVHDTPTVKITDKPVVTTTGSESCSAGTQDPALCSSACEASSDCNLVKTYVNPFINKFLSPLAILAVIIGIIWGAIEFATAGGDSQKVASGKGKIQRALFGLAAYLFLWAFLSWILPGGLGG